MRVAISTSRKSEWNYGQCTIQLWIALGARVNRLIEEKNSSEDCLCESWFGKHYLIYLLGAHVLTWRSKTGNFFTPYRQWNVRRHQRRPEAWNMWSFRCHIAFMVVESALIGVWGEFLVVNAYDLFHPSAVRTKLLSWSEVDFVAHTTVNSLYFFISSSSLTRCLTHINAIINLFNIFTYTRESWQGNKKGETPREMDGIEIELERDNLFAHSGAIKAWKCDLTN